MGLRTRWAAWQLPRFCSVGHSMLRKRLDGEHLYCSPDFELIGHVLGHFLEAYRRAEVATSGTFVLPVWADRSWWRLLRGARVVAYYPAGTPLFTSPDWRQPGQLVQAGVEWAPAIARAFQGV